MAGKTVVIFPGNGYDEHVQAISSLNANSDYIVNVVGVGNSSGSPTIKPTTSGAAFSLLGNTNGKKTQVSFDGMVFDGAALADNASDMIDCTGGGGVVGLATLKITRSIVKRAPAMGLYAQALCTVTLDGDIFANNTKGGLQLLATDFALTNLLIRDNGTGGSAGSSFGGLNVGGGTPGKMTAFNLTVVNNKARDTGTGIGGMACTNPPTTVANSVFFKNAGNFDIVAGDCNPTWSAFPNAASLNNNRDIQTCTLAGLFTDPTDPVFNFIPKKGTAPCTLVDAGTAIGAPGHDFNGSMYVNTPDIGAFEAP
jgi:hypothetical protein